jgi:hypothetical protein
MMKNAIMYYYNLTPPNIHQNEKYYWFEIEKQSFILTKCKREISEIESIYKLSLELLYRNYSINEIILNKDNGIITVINGENYILLKNKHKKREKISLADILTYSDFELDFSSYNKLYRNNWNELWSLKVDYLEYQISHFGKKYPIIRESFSYFCGMAENAIVYSNGLYINDLKISHKRITTSMTMFDLHNPLELIIDFKVRDASEYFKAKFFSGFLSFEEIRYYLEYKLKIIEYESFFTRMFFPSFYFDVFEEIIGEKEKEKEIIKIISKIDKYEELLAKIYNYIASKTYILKPDWLIKNMA